MKKNIQVGELLEGARYIVNKEEYPKDATIYYHEDDVGKAIMRVLTINEDSHQWELFKAEQKGYREGYDKGAIKHSGASNP